MNFSSVFLLLYHTFNSQFFGLKINSGFINTQIFRAPYGTLFRIIVYQKPYFFIVPFLNHINKIVTQLLSKIKHKNNLDNYFNNNIHLFTYRI